MRNTIVLLLLLFPLGGQAGPFIGFMAGPTFASVDAPATPGTPTLYTTKDKNGFFAGITAGYRYGSWSLTMAYGTADNHGATASGNTLIPSGLHVPAGAISPSYTVTSRTVREVDDALLMLTMGRSFKLDDMASIEINAGAAYRNRETMDMSTVQTRNPETGQVIDIRHLSSLDNEHTTTGTVGAAFIVSAGSVNYRIGVQHYGALNMTLPMVGIDYAF